jgi:hypothetical protein
MPRWAIALLGALGVAGLGVAVYRATQGNRIPERAPSARASNAPPTASLVAPVETSPVEEAPSASPAHPFNGYDTLPDGKKIGELPGDAPRSISFGVVLVTYKGAERAPNNARPKSEALDMAKRLAEDAKANFNEAVKKGDPAPTRTLVPSGEWAEPVLEYVLFR